MARCVIFIAGICSYAGSPPGIQNWQQHLPLAFERNAGQWSRDVRYVARIRAGFIALDDSGAMVSVRDSRRQTQSLLSIRPVHPNSGVLAEGVEDTGGKSSYFFGTDPSKWRTNIANFSRVRYKHIYDGIDLVFHANQSDLEYDFIVLPGADTSRIEMEFRGAQALHLNPAGDLIIEANGLSLTQHTPILYQEKDGARTEIAGQYVIRGRNRATFRVGAYDHSRTLIIDPVLSYSAILGGSGWDSAFAIAADSTGNAYVTGITPSSDFPALPNSLHAGAGSSGDVFICKLNPSGSALLYSAFVSGGQGNGIAVDGDGNAYVTGITASSTFATTPGSYQSPGIPTSTPHVFVLKLNASGNALIYSAVLGGNFADTAAAIAIDQNRNAYVTGQAGSTTFPTTPGAYQLSKKQFSAKNAFVTKLNDTGTALVYSSYLGGSTNDNGNAIAVDSSGSAYVAGSTTSSDFPVTAGSFQPVNPLVGLGSAFVTKLNPTGAGLSYSTFLNAGGSSSANGIAVDASGNAYVAGAGAVPTFLSSVSSGPLGGGDIFVVQLNTLGSALSYALSIGGSAEDSSTGIAIDSARNVYVSGWTKSSDFPMLSPVQAIPGISDLVTKNPIIFALNSSGALAYATYLGGSNIDIASAVAADPTGNAYVTGTNQSTDFPLTPGVPSRPQHNGPNPDAFVAKFSAIPACTFSLSSSIDSVPIAGGDRSVTVTAPPGCNWIAVSNQSWITLTNGVAGSGSGAVSYSVKPNPSQPRSAILSVAGMPFTVSQANGCEYSLPSPSQNAPASGGFMEVAINAGNGCSWTLSNVPSWMMLLSGPSVGTATLIFQVLANTGNSPRSAILTIGGLQFVVNQAGGFACTLSIYPGSQQFDHFGGRGSVAVTTVSGCAWQGVSNSPWLRVIDTVSNFGTGSAGIGSGSIDYAVDFNGGVPARSGGITIGDKTIAVTEAGSGAPGTASFVGLDSATQGNWHGRYGGDGFFVIGDQSVSPQYAIPIWTGVTEAVWTSSTTDRRALQKGSNPSDRVAAAWYSSDQFQVEFNFTDNNKHQIAVYLLDWDTSARHEVVDILDGAWNVLSTRALTSSFHGGVYLVWSVSGLVRLRVTRTGGANAVLSGVFFDSGSLPTAPVLSISKTHAGDFTQGQQNAVYIATVSNAMNAAPAIGTVTVAETLPPGLTLVSMFGNGWACNGNSCNRNDSLAGGNSYPPITVTVNVAGNASSPQVNQASVSGGTSASASVTDSTMVSLSNSAPGSAAFLKLDTATQGNWPGAYGSDGSVVIGDTAYNPSYVTPAPQGQAQAVWMPTTNDTRALDKVSNGSIRIAATWYSNTSFTVDLNITDGNIHQMAAYFLDWDTTARRERVDILDASGNVLNTQNLTTSFQGGVYLVWNLSGHVQLRVTLTGGANAVLSGLFFAPVSNANSPLLSIIKTHTGNFTQGQQNATFTVTVSNANNAGPTNGPVTVTETVPSGLPLVAMLGSGWSCSNDTCTRSDALAGGSSYPPITVTVNVTANAGTSQMNSVSLSGGGSGPSFSSDEATVNLPTQAPSSASFVKSDTAAQGNWHGVYGGDGYQVIGDAWAQPAYVGQSTILNFATWAAATNDVRALQKGSNPAQRVAAAYYASNSFTVDVSMTDTNTHQLAAYFLDWDTTARREKVEILDGNGNVLDTRQLTSSFHGGVYLVWNVSGHVQVRVTLTGGANAVLSGLFWGGGGSSSLGISSFVKLDTTTQGNWHGAYGAAGYAVIGDQTSNPSYVTPVASGQSQAVWVQSSADVRALQKAFNLADRIAGVWYGANSFTVDLNFTDANTHQVAVYCLDWDTTARRQKVDVLDANGIVLNSQNLTSSFHGGAYLVWNLSGHVKLRVTLTGGANPVISGLFFD